MHCHKYTCKMSNEPIVNPGLKFISEIQHATSSLNHHGYIEDRDPKGNTIHLIIITTVCSIGLVENACALVVIFNSSMIRITSGVYLCFIALFDNFVLAFHLMVTYSNLIHSSDFLCKSMISV